LAERVGISVGFLNRCLQQLVKNGHVRVADCGVRPFAYRVTAAGKHHHDHLMYEHYRSVLGGLLGLERRVEERLCGLQKKGVQRVVFYGAGEVMSIAHKCALLIGLNVMAVVDDDIVKHGQVKDGLPIHAPTSLDSLRPDAIVITTLRHAPEIRRRFPRSGQRSPIIWHL
jgi:hypothetical protein